MNITADDIDGPRRDGRDLMTQSNVDPGGKLFGNALHASGRDAGRAPDEGLQHDIEEAPGGPEFGVQEDPG